MGRGGQCWSRIHPTCGRAGTVVAHPPRTAISLFAFDSLCHLGNRAHEHDGARDCPPASCLTTTNLGSDSSQVSIRGCGTEYGVHTHQPLQPIVGRRRQEPVYRQAQLSLGRVRACAWGREHDILLLLREPDRWPTVRQRGRETDSEPQPLAPVPIRHQRCRHFLHSLGSCVWVGLRRLNETPRSCLRGHTSHSCRARTWTFQNTVNCALVRISSFENLPCLRALAKSEGEGENGEG